MPDRLAEIHARLDAATPGPWIANKRTHRNGDYGWVAEIWGSLNGGGGALPAVCLANEVSGDDADLIAHAPADISWLLDEVERLTARVRIYEDVKS